MQTSTPDPVILKLRSPDDILEAVPYLLGFEPTESLVALSLRGPRRRLGLTLRVDVVLSDGVEVLAAQVVSSLCADRAESVVLVGYAGPDRPAVDSLVAAVLAGLSTAGLAVAEALRVHEGRWTSYTCRGPCCPPEGTEVRDRVAAPSGVGVAAVAAGHSVFAGRDALAATVAPVTGLLGAAMSAALDRELDHFESAQAVRAQAYRAATVELVHAVLERNRGDSNDNDNGNGNGSDGDDRGPTAFVISVDDAARILVGVLDVDVRDALLDGWGGPSLPADLRPGAERLWAELLRRAVVPGLVAPVATLLAWNLYVHHGGGAMVTIALERALDDVPGYVMAEGLLSLLMGGVSPARFADLVAGGSGGGEQGGKRGGGASPSRRRRQRAR